MDSDALHLTSGVAARPAPHYLSFGWLIPGLLVFLGIAIPLIYWSGAYDPAVSIRDETRWLNPLSESLVVALSAVLFLVPLCWVVAMRVLDMLALVLVQNALVFLGYFYLESTAGHLPESNIPILKMAGLVVLFNAVGFACFLGALAVTYGLLRSGGFVLRPLLRPAGMLDWRLVWLVRGLSVVCIGAIALPMVLTHSIPLLAADVSEARVDIQVDSSLGRAVYNLGAALLPFLTGTLIMAILAYPRRLVGCDTLLIVGMLGLQLLSSNRLPLSIALMVTFCLVTMQYHLPRMLLVFIFVGYIGLFTFLSGFSSLLRVDPGALREKNWMSASVEQAFLGDNIIDLRDGTWVVSQWDFQPLMGKTYLGGAADMIPSGLFPEKKQWHLGLTGVRIVGLPEDEHFGLRVTFFGEAFLNFGWAGVVMLGLCLGSMYGVMLREVHLVAGHVDRSCLCRNLLILILMQAIQPLSNTSDAFLSWTLLGLMLFIWLVVVLPRRWPGRTDVLPFYRREGRRAA